MVDAVKSIGGQGSLNEIYAAITRLSTKELPRTWQAIVRRELEHNSSDSKSFQKRHDLFFSIRGIGNGFWGLRSQLENTPVAFDLNEPPARKVQFIHRIIRDTTLTKLIKHLHHNTCQICGMSLHLSAEKTYAEAHHIQPLGAPHNGPDIAENILILCPNHHALCDFGAVPLNPKTLRTADGHNIGLNFLEYHNHKIFNRDI